MPTYDSDTKEQFFAHREEEHNKFYVTSIDETALSATVKWGRFGTSGQKQTKTFSSIYEAVSFIRGKISEKQRKGYQRIDANRFKEMSIQAAIIGSANKCHSLQWMEIQSDQHLKPATPERLACPDCNPALYVALETKKSYGGQHEFRLAFTEDKVYLFTTWKTFSLKDGKPISKQDSIYELASKIEEAVGKSMCG